MDPGDHEQVRTGDGLASAHKTKGDGKMKENRYAAERRERRLQDRRLAIQKAQARKVKELLRSSGK